MRHFETLSPIGLTPNQALALPRLAAATSIAEGAKRAQISRSTLHRWMQDAHFRAELQRFRDEAAEIAFAKLESLMLESVLVLAELIDDPNPAIRQRAARTALNAGLKANEITDLQHRIDVLDSAISILKGQL